MNSHWLKSSKFVKFLRDCGLIKHGVLQNHNLKKSPPGGANSENHPNRKSQFK